MELGYILVPERTKDKTFLELHIFKARDGATYSYIFPFSFFFLEILVLSLRKKSF